MIGIFQEGQYLRETLHFSTKKQIIFGVSIHIQKSKNKKENFQTILDKTFVGFFTF